MHLVFEQIRTGGDRNFGYLLGDRQAGQAVLIDPSYSPEILAQRAIDQGLKVTHIINTHGHDDHINGNAKAAELTGAKVAAHPDCPALPEIKLEDEQEIPVGELLIKVLHTPGHSPDHIVLYEKSYRVLITGDFIFVGKVGGTEDAQGARHQWNSIQRMIAEIPDATTIWPGHDVGARPSSTIGMEKKSNPFFLCQDFTAFNQLKNDWPMYKKRFALK